ncbi:formyltransferase family protein [Actinokineospora soli]|uniref:Formyltransferase family protein n=1 Tax=Actinokineospora soli TaxID=1048753 RepID=A0ABW2TPC1_9PSEU
MNIFLSGRGAFAVQVAEAFGAAGHSIVGVASPRTRKGHTDDENPLAWDRVRSWAYPRQVAWTDARELRAVHIPDKTEVIVAAHSHAFIGRKTRAKASVAAIGYHPSLLPLHRGRDAIRWTIRDGDRVTGGTVYHLTERTDGGPIAAQEHILVPRKATAESLWREHLAPLGVRLLLRVVDDLASGRRVEVEQDESLATWEPSMDSAPLFKPELIELPSAGAEPVIGDRWALIDH